MRTSDKVRLLAAATWLVLLHACGDSGGGGAAAASPLAKARLSPAGGAGLPSRRMPGPAMASMASTKTLAPTADAALPVTFRQGLDGYEGVTDVSVGNRGMVATGERGQVSNGTTAGVYRELGGGGHESRSFLRFDGLQALQGRRVRHAELGLTFRGGAHGHELSLQVLNRAWKPGGARFGWTQTGTGERWDVPGGGTGDWENGPVAIVSGFTGDLADTHTVVLPAELVQQWIDRPGSNHGLALVAATNGKASWLRSSEDSQAEWRPTLRLWLH